MAQEKIAILGGGIASLSAAFALSQAPQNYAITVYQMGWRVGGKGASGRNRDHNERIEEHGLHVWSGIYENAFRVIRQCYAEIKRAPDAPLAGWQDAFKPANFFVLEEQFKDRWVDWLINVPSNDALPGEPDAKLTLSLWQYIGEAIAFIREQHGTPTKTHASSTIWLTILQRFVGFTQRILSNLNIRGILLWLARQIARLQWSFMQTWGRNIILWLLEGFMRRLWQRTQPKIDNDDLRRRWIIINFAYANLRGALENNVIEHGFDQLDGDDYREWLARYIYPDYVDSRSLTLNAPPAWFLYDAIFAYREGDLNKPDLAAGVALRVLVRMAFTFKGALIWKMQAGMGDTVFTPLYQALKQRGVKFEFFHRVDGIQLNADKSSIASINLGIQARIKHGDYDPLVMVKGLACWPSAPLYEQLHDGDHLHDVNFESATSPVVGQRTLHVGVDFDRVVLGISLAALPRICGELIAANAAWRDMIANIPTVRTQAAQLWIKKTAYELGWHAMGDPMLTTYRVNPLDTWADMTHLIEREAWPASDDQYPLNLAYFCGVMPEGVDDPTIALEQTRKTTEDLLDHHIAHLWGNATLPPHDPNAPFDYDVLIDDTKQPKHGKARLMAQYLRANIEGSERYVQTPKGSTRYRLQPRQSGFKNLVIAGDWTDNSMNQGNIECTVMSGLLAANAISGFPARSSITGVDFGR